ncbi:MAG TPA: hypothetical protein VNQ33_12320 [Acidimicrobiales bacterium]|nr:hypothetical protein [Acidimicrobiales bacterium]
MTGLGSKVVGLHLALDGATIPHAFGGALALAFCTLRPRGTSDIDLNVFLSVAERDRFLTSLPREVTPTEEQRMLLERDGQARLFWDRTPIDVFLDTTHFHRGARLRIQWQEFGGHLMPFLGCSDLAVFKAFFDRTKDWADLEEMIAAGSLDRERVLGALVLYLGGSDPRIERLRTLGPPGTR